MYIIDTHVLLWYLRNSGDLSELALNTINTTELIYTSMASLWEIAIKQSIGKLDLDFSITQIENRLQRKGYSNSAHKIETS